MIMENERKQDKKEEYSSSFDYVKSSIGDLEQIFILGHRIPKYLL